jgi:ribosome-associated protein
MLQDLGEQLIGLQDDLLDSLSLDESLRAAILEARRMKSHEARRRQKQYIGKLMRDVDAEPINALFARLKADDRREKRVFANAERWRDRLLKDGTEALQAFEEDTGQPDPELASLLIELDGCHSDRLESTLRRKLFRRIHATLAAGVTDG